MTITADKVQRNSFTDNLGTDWIGVDANGRIAVRADTREAAEQAYPQAAAYFTGADLDGTTGATPTPEKTPSPIEAALGTIKTTSVEKTETAEQLQAKLDEANAQIAKMDPDGDGKVGGSRRKKSS